MAGCFVCALALALGSEGSEPGWLSSYDEACRIAAAEDRPILLCFSPAGAPEDCPQLRGNVGGGSFVRVFVSKRTALGQRIYKLFGVAGDDACVVVERGRQHQFCRYERPLTANEWRTVATTTAAAKGRPLVDPLDPAVAIVPAESPFEAVSAYVPATPSAVAPALQPVAEPAAPRAGPAPSASPLPPAYPHWLAPAPGDCPNCRRAGF